MRAGVMVKDKGPLVPHNKFVSGNIHLMARRPSSGTGIIAKPDSMRSDGSKELVHTFHHVEAQIE